MSSVTESVAMTEMQDQLARLLPRRLAVVAGHVDVTSGGRSRPRACSTRSSTRAGDDGGVGAVPLGDC